MFYKLVRNVVEDAVAVLDNRRQFQCQALLHFFGKRVSVNGLGIGIAHFHQFFIGAGNFRVVRLPFLGKRMEDFAFVCNPSRIFHDDFKRFFLGEIAEFIQHFLCRPDVDRRMGFNLPRFFPVGKKDVAVSLILGKHIMRIRRSADRPSSLFADFNDLPVQILQILFRIDFGKLVVIDQEFIISKRLHFQIVIELRHLDQFFITLSCKNCAEEFAHDAGRTVNQPFVEFL